MKTGKPISRSRALAIADDTLRRAEFERLPNWVLGEEHQLYGKVVMMRTIEGEPYRFFKDEHGSISMIPLECL